MDRNPDRPRRLPVRGADAVAVIALADVEGVANRRQLAGFRIRLALAAPGNIVDLLVLAAVHVEPALDNLDAIEVAALRVLARHDHERRGPGSCGLRSPPIGTPSAWPSLTNEGFARSAAPKFHPPKNRTLIIVPDVPKVSLRCIASKIASRVFSSAQHRNPIAEICWPSPVSRMPLSSCLGSCSIANLPLSLNSSLLPAALCVYESSMQPYLKRLPLP